MSRTGIVADNVDFYCSHKKQPNVITTSHSQQKRSECCLLPEYWRWDIWFVRRRWLETSNFTGWEISNQTGCKISNQTGWEISNQTGLVISNQTGSEISNKTGKEISNQTGWERKGWTWSCLISSIQAGCSYLISHFFILEFDFDRTQQEIQ